MIREDYLLREIRRIFDFLRKLLGRQGKDSYLSEDMNRLEEDLNLLVARGRIDQAEDLLFASFSQIDEYLLLAINFYESLNEKGEEELRRGNFSREEIGQGIRDLASQFGLPLDLFP